MLTSQLKADRATPEGIRPGGTVARARMPRRTSPLPVWLTGVATAWLLVTAAAAGPLDEEERLQFADGLYSRGMHDLASREYEVFLKNFPKAAKADAAHFRLGECYDRLGKADLAESEFRRVFAESAAGEFRFKAGYRLAELLLLKGKDKEGIETCRSLIKANPPADIAVAAWYALGDACVKNGKTDEAAEAYEKIRQAHASSKLYPYALMKLGHLYASDGAAPKSAGGSRESRLQTALKFFNEAAAKAGSDRVAAEAIFQVATLYFREKDFQKSAEFYKKLLTTYPKDPRSEEAMLQAAWAAHNAGLYVDAVKIADGALQGAAAKTPAGPDQRAEWLYLKANGERQLMQNDAAAKTYSELLAKFPASPFGNTARYETAVVYYRMGKFDEAIGAAEKVELKPEVAKDVYWLMAESYGALKKPAEAIQYYRLIVKEFPKSDVAVDALYRLAHHLQAKAEYREASEYYSLLAAQHAEHKLATQALFASAFCLSKAEMFEEAVRDWGTLIRKYPADALVETALYQKAMSEIRLKRNSDAANSLRDLLKRFAGSEFAPDAHYWLGVLLLQENKTEEAEAAFRESMKKRPKGDMAGETEFHLGMVLRKQGKDAEAADLFGKLLALPVREKFPLSTLQWLAEYDFGKNDFKGTVSAGRVILERSPEPAWQQIGWGLVGRGHMAAGETGPAEEAFKKALTEKAATPFLPEAALRLGEIALATNDHRSATGYFQKAAETANSEAMLGIRARAYAGLGRSAKAASDLENAGRYLMSVAVLYDDPDLVPQCLFEAAEAFTRMGKKEAADQAIKELKQRYPASEYARRAGRPDGSKTP